MQLEDHIGDIVRKARGRAKVPLAAVAQVAGLGEAELGTLEETGITARKPNYAALAALVGLNGDKFGGIAKGWVPEERDLGLWRELRWLTNQRGGMPVNCYLVWDEVTREAALFDTGWEAAPISALVAENQLQLRHIFITHWHEDHVAALEELRRTFPKVRLHLGAKNAPVDQRNRANEIVQLGSLRVSHRDTPGHSEDGTTYIVGNWPEDAPHAAFVGDALFAGSMGRGNQSWELATQKVKEQILSLPPDTLICPGHGPLTTVAEEKKHNPFF
jgi:hydroxyacylglutathione hydrolase